MGIDMDKMLPQTEKLFSRDGTFTRWLEVEKALANAQAKLGIIPEGAAAQICRNARIECLDMEQYDEIYQKTGHPMVSLLRLLEHAAGDAGGQYIHMGATTQDVMDTAMMLAIKQMMERIDGKLKSMVKTVCNMALKYADTPMIGRTHNIQALPITFGYKAAIWASELYRCIERLEESKKRILVLQLSGAVGSMVSFGDDGEMIQRLMSEELELSVPDICWHVSRDRFAEFAGQMTLISGALGRIAQEVYLLMGTEYGELSECWGDSRVGSSTMPHKVNPTSTQHMLAKAMHIRYNSGEIMELMLVDHERNMQHFIGEREKLEEICIYTAELLDRGEELLETLWVNEEKMLMNLHRLNGLTQSENIMFELGKTIGKQNAHKIVGELAVSAYNSGLNFEEELKKSKAVTEVLTSETIHELLNPMKYIGKCPQMTRTAAKGLLEKIGD